MQSCELSVIKYLLFAFNFIFAVSGLGLIIAGATVLSDVGEFSHFLEGHILATPVVLIFTGCIVFLVASLGCFGAIRESYKLLILFAICLFIILIMELAVGIAAAVYRNEFQSSLESAMRKSFNSYNDSRAEQFAWNGLQSKLKCCGISGPNDWPKEKRPLSCCHTVRADLPPPEQFHCNGAVPGDEILYDVGCFDKLKLKAESNAAVLIGVGIGIAFVEVIGILLALWLAFAIKYRRE